MKKYRFSFTPNAAAVKGCQLTIKLNTIDHDVLMIWMDVYESWVVSIYRYGKPLTTGRVAVLNQDLLGNIHDIGTLRFEGDEPTANNIGRDCFLYYYEAKK
ncbi:TPA: hypothetical protein VGT17_005220 [Vibrio harveyi]|nr:hypothetical protein [Vibrio harveyi]HEQ3599252.1 hypothetical protein [Vibrio harveyi]HEQ3611310.1 hypothetical protein [Vibrio harveyi]